MPDADAVTGGAGASVIFLRTQRRPKVYIDRRDWWVGYFRGTHHHYVCPLPCVVIRWPRRRVTLANCVASGGGGGGGLYGGGASTVRGVGGNGNG